MKTKTPKKSPAKKMPMPGKPMPGKGKPMPKGC
jgi:hypothetical protein